MRLTCASVCWIAGLALACGDARSPGASDAGTSASDQAAPLADAADAGDDGAPEASAQDDAAPDVACPASLPLASWPGAPWDGGTAFNGAQDLVSYFQQLARTAQLIVPAHQVSCTQAGVALGECTYDPRQPEHDPADVHYSDALDRFVGPDGYNYVWLHVAAGDRFLVADAEGAPASYQLILDWVRCHGSEA
jgi:hypothetical protein